MERMSPPVQNGLFIGSGYGLPEIPRGPFFGIYGYCRGIFLKGDQIVESVFLSHVAGLNEAHEHVPYNGPIRGFIKQGVLPVDDGLFQSTFADIIVEWGTGDFEETGQSLPVFHHVGSGFSQV